jgi:hypothetical protein
MNYLKKLEDVVSAWPNVSVHPHRFGGREFQFGDAEVGRVQPRVPCAPDAPDRTRPDGTSHQHYRRRKRHRFRPPTQRPHLLDPDFPVYRQARAEYALAEI